MYNLVFEGGGINAITYIGALKYLEENNIKINNVAGSSAGAIVASLISSGYKSNELKDIFMSKDFTDLQSENLIGKVPLVGKIYNLIVNKGIYKTDKLVQWLDRLLLKKGVKTFKDVSNLKVIAVDITKKEVIVFPDDAYKYNLKEEELDISLVVAMSSTIPLYFMPFKIEKSYIVDGGVLSEFPLYLFDKSNTLGFLIDESYTKNNDTFKDYIKILVSALTSNDQSKYIDDYNVIKIPVVDIDSTDFNLTNKQKTYLYKAGYFNTKNYFESQNF